MKPDVIEVLSDPDEIQALAFNLIKLARDEILIMFSISSPLVLKQRIEGLELLLGAALLHNVRIKILTVRTKI